ncbi:MAG: SxtJ family membrane protein [Gemmataceae bacterium]
MTWKDIPRRPSKTMLRQFGFLCLLFFGGIGAWKLANDQTVAGVILCSLGAVGGFLGAFAPKSLRRVFVGWMMAVFPIGWLVSHGLLGAIFFLIFTPVGLCRRLLGKDALKLRRPLGETYWLPKPAAAGAASYYHQF